MAQPEVQRRLAAIIAADVVGYSRLVGTDEVGTLNVLKAIRKELVEPAIAEHHGRIVKLTGDGILIEFASAVDAVNCAVAVQRGMAARNIDLPEDRRIEYRAGINVGDVVVEGEDIYGDGVNVAARLEGIAQPGGICISEDTYRQVRGKVIMDFADLGPQKLKNIARPVRVFRVVFGDRSSTTILHSVGMRRIAIAGLAVALLLAVVSTAWQMRSGIMQALSGSMGPPQTVAAPRLSIVVLPFANLSGDPTQDYVADILTDELTTSLSRIKGAFVIARTTAFTYKGKAVDVKQIGRDLGVRYALEGSEQHNADRMRVNVQLINAETGAHVWADKFDADHADFFGIQDDIVIRLARTLEVQLSAIDAARVEQARPGNLDAEDLARRCKAGAWNTAPLSQEWEAALALCAQALQIDDRNVTALSHMSFWYILPVIEAQSADPQAAIRQADELASRALTIDPNDYFSYYSKASVLLAQNRHEEAIIVAERGRALNPGFVENYFIMYLAYHFLGRPDRAIEYADTVIRLSPRDPAIFITYHFKGQSFFMKEQYGEAIEWLKKSAAEAPGAEPFTYLVLASAYALTGRDRDAQDEFKRYLSLSRTKTTTITEFKKQQLSLANNPNWVAYNERLFNGLRIAGMAEE